MAVDVLIASTLVLAFVAATALAIRSSRRRVTTALRSVALVAAVIATSVAGLAQAPASVASTSSGFTYIDAPFHSHAVSAISPGGLSVVVDSRAPHHAALAADVKNVVQQMRHLGIPVTYGAVHAKSKKWIGIVFVTESAAGCDDSGEGLVGVAQPNWQDPEPHDGSLGMDVIGSGSIDICSGLWSKGAAAFLSTVRHEMGHSVGLGHFQGLYEGKTQLMNGFASSVTSYQAGDIAGLKAIARNTKRVAAAMKPRGHITSMKRVGNRIEFTGVYKSWGPYNPNVAITIDGKKVGGAHTAGGDAPVKIAGSKALVKGRHRYCLVIWNDLGAATSKVTPLGCTTRAR